MSVVLDIDVRALRRIALLVMRANQDCGPGCPELHDIVSIIERMKRNVAIGSPFAIADLRKMISLIDRLRHHNADRCRLRSEIVDELDDLVHTLPAAS